MVPVIKRQISAYQLMTLPNAALFPLQIRFPVKFRVDYLKLMATLDTLDISSPPDYASRREWYSYLVRLEILAATGNLEEARQLKVDGYPLDTC